MYERTNSPGMKKTKGRGGMSEQERQGGVLTEKGLIREQHTREKNLQKKGERKG